MRLGILRVVAVHFISVVHYEHMLKILWKSILIWPSHVELKFIEPITTEVVTHAIFTYWNINVPLI